jgi:ATP-dependent Zn protease
VAAGSGRGAAARAGRVSLTAADLASARDRVLLGTRRASPLAPGELATVAVHEAGHALVAALSPHADPVSRVTVLGAGQALGLTETLPADDRRLYGERYPPAGYPALAGSRGYSEHTQWLVDQEVAAILAKAETRARDLLTSHREALDWLTAALRPGAPVRCLRSFGRCPPAAHRGRRSSPAQASPRCRRRRYARVPGRDRRSR